MSVEQQATPTGSPLWRSQLPDKQREKLHRVMAAWHDAVVVLDANLPDGAHKHQAMDTLDEALQYIIQAVMLPGSAAS